MLQWEKLAYSIKEETSLLQMKEVAFLLQTKETGLLQIRDVRIFDQASGIQLDMAICRISGIRPLKGTECGYLTVFRI